IVSKPAYILSTEPSPRNVSIGPGWGKDEKDIQFISQISDEIEDIKFKSLKEGFDEVRFEIDYKGNFNRCNEIIEIYKLNKEGLEIDDIAKGEIKVFKVQIPLLETDGETYSKIEIGRNFFVVKYKNHKYIVKCIEPENVSASIEKFSASNRNGVYKIGCFTIKNKHIKYKINME
ncbi:MAG: hypothetical protein NC915_05305, partial [Candidatus Omnitrophica bacterium]|nr:hypothetical protein [Candidatus Omnitrophota bacterium]